MIPKVIHYCWLSNDPVPPKLQACIDSWKRVMPDYEVKLWNFDRFPRGKSAWVDQAFDCRKYAFAADYIRAYALYHEGGIYFDSDVEAVRPFDDLLEAPYAVCRECGSGLIEAAAMCAEAGHPLMGRLLDYYDNRRFVKEDGSLDTVGMPAVRGRVLDGMKFRQADVDSIAQYGNSGNTLYVLPYDYFSPINIENMDDRRTARTYSVHHFAGSWLPPYRRFKKRVQKFLGPKMAQVVIDAKRRVKRLFGAS
ncbi:MAG: glycosyl transferase [Muribaculaceae bacterium]|nr:glycosyl transferase [Muribaculaceae bacterium]